MPEHPESEAAIVGLDKEIEHAPRCPDQGPGANTECSWNKLQPHDNTT